MMWFLVALSVGAGQAQQAPASTAAVGEAYFLFLQGRMLEGRGDVQGAIAAYRSAIDLMPKAADVRAELAGLYAREGRAAESVAEGEAALTIDPDNHEAHRILGLVKSAIADNTSAQAEQRRLMMEAAGHLEKALAGGRRDPGVEISLGRLYVRTGQYDKAVPTLDNFLTDQPGYPEGILMLVEALDATGQQARAITMLEPLVKAEPDLARARGWLAELLDAAGRPVDALPHWRELARTNPRNVAIRTRFATSLVNQGELTEGRQVLLELAGEFPQDIAVWYLVSQVENRTGNAEGAERAANRIREIDSSDPRGPLALAEARSARGDHRGAVATLEPVLEALRDTPTGGGAYARVAVELAGALSASGARDRGIRVLEDARTRDPRSAEVLEALADAYLDAERFDVAERAYRDLLEADPGNPEWLAGLGWAQVKQGQAGLGRDQLEKAVAAMPNDVTILDHLAEALFQLKDYRGAAALWDRVLASRDDTVDVKSITDKRDRARRLAGRN